MAFSDLAVRQAKTTGKRYCPLRQRLPGPDDLSRRRQVVVIPLLLGTSQYPGFPSEPAQSVPSM